MQTPPVKSVWLLVWEGKEGGKHIEAVFDNEERANKECRYLNRDLRSKELWDGWSVEKFEVES